MGLPLILCVDDEIDNLDALERLFRQKFRVLKAQSGQEALEVLKKTSEAVSIILTDQRMPGMSGVELLEKTLSSHPETVRMLLTGYTDLDSVISAVNQGQIFRYLTKPWDPNDLLNSVNHAAERFNLAQQLAEKNKALEQALRELQTLDQAKTHFMVIVNHELKTPLTSLMSFLDLLGETKLDEEQKLFIDRLKKSTDRLATLVHDVLTVVKSATGNLPLHKAKTKISKLQFQPSDEAQALFAQKNQKISVSKVDAEINVDARLLQEVLHRLIHNAIKFGDQDSEIKIDVVKKSSEVLFFVSDSGPQIPEELITRVLAPFFIDENYMNHTQGLGLGLTICQSLLKLHASDLEIKNHSNGVTVGFSLQLA